MLRIGLTGGIGSGKSTVARLFARHGIPVIDTDEIGRRLTEPGQPGYDAVISAFGSEITGESGKIDRARLRRRVFADPRERTRLEVILHPLIRDEVRRALAPLRTPYCIVVVPLLVETGFTGLIDRVLVVEADEDIRAERVRRRSGLPAAEIRHIMAAQASNEARRSYADDIIDNNGDLAHLEREVERLHAAYLGLSGG